MIHVLYTVRVLMACASAMECGLVLRVMVSIYKILFSNNIFFSKLILYSVHHEPVVIVTNETNPSAQIQTYNKTSQVQFSIAMRALQERNSNGDSVSNIRLDNLNFTFVESYLSSSRNIMWEYSTVLKNKATINITVSFFFIIFLFLKTFTGNLVH